MKRKIPILLSLILLITSSGFTLDKHYCEGRMVNIFLLPHFGNCCDSGMAMGDNSCEDDFIVFSSERTMEIVKAKITLTRSVSLTEFLKLSLPSIDFTQYVKVKRASSYFLPFVNIEIYLQGEVFLM